MFSFFEYLVTLRHRDAGKIGQMTGYLKERYGLCNLHRHRSRNLGPAPHAHWGKKAKIIEIGENKSPLGSLRSPIFFLFFSPLRILVPGYRSRIEGTKLTKLHMEHKL